MLIELTFANRVFIDPLSIESVMDCVIDRGYHNPSRSVVYTKTGVQFDVTQSYEEIAAKLQSAGFDHILTPAQMELRQS